MPLSFVSWCRCLFACSFCDGALEEDSKSEIAQRLLCDSRSCESSGIFRCGLDCFLAVFSFIPLLPEWAHLQQVCRRWHQACRLPAWVTLLKPTTRDWVTLMDFLDEKDRTPDFYRQTIKLVQLFNQELSSASMSSSLDTKVKTITKRAIKANDLKCVEMGLEYLSADADVDKESLLVISLSASSHDVFHLLLKRNADVSTKWLDQSLAARLGLGCAWPAHQKRPVFDQLRSNDEILPELEAATLGDRAWLERLAKDSDELERKLCFRADVQGFNPLHYACSSNQLGIVKWLVESGFATPNDASVNGLTPLARASWNGHTQVVEYLLRRQANIDQTGNDKVTSLAWAASAGKEAVVHVLLEAKADVNLLDVDGCSALVAGVESSHFNVCKELLDGRADVNQCQKHGWTPLHRAAVAGDHAVAALLIVKKATIDAKDDAKRTPLYLAVQKRHFGIVHMLLEVGAAIYHTTNLLRTPIHMALSTGDRRLINMLLERGVDVNQPDAAHKSFFYHALQSQEPDLVLLKSMLEQKAQLDPPGVEQHHLPINLLATKERMKPIAQMILEAKFSDSFIVAIVGGDTELLRKQLALGHVDDRFGNLLFVATVHANDDVLNVLLEHQPASPTELSEALQEACIRGNLKIVQALVEAKASINPGGDLTDDDTPLTHAAGNGHVGVVSYLLEQKANIDQYGDNGRTALMRVAWCQDLHLSVLELLLEARANVNLRSLEDTKYKHLPSGQTALALAVRKNHVEFVQRLLGAKASVHEIDDQHHETALHYAARLFEGTCAELLLDAGANAMQTNKFGKTPLYIAAKKGRKEVMNVLVAVGTPDLFAALLVKDMNLLRELVGAKSDVNVMKQGKTPLYVASKRQQQDAVAFLLQAKASPVKRCDNGETPLQIATKVGNKEIMELLLQPSHGE